MLSEEFISRLSEAFPEFHDRVNASAKEEASRLIEETNGDLEKALLKARILGAGRLWWPYVKGTVPFVGKDREAMEGFTQLVLTVDHLVGQAPDSMTAAREQVTSVLRESLDYERLLELVKREQAKARPDGGPDVGPAAGLIASASTLMVPITNFRRVRKVARFVPVPLRVAITAVIVAAVASVPLVAGYSAGVRAEESARRVHAGAPVIDVESTPEPEAADRD